MKSTLKEQSIHYGVNYIKYLSFKYIVNHTHLQLFSPVLEVKIICILHYFISESLGIPAWLSITFTGFIILGISGIIFAVLQKFIIINNQPPPPTSSTVPLTS